MRKRSAANSAASSPPVPARISRMTFLASLGSFGTSSTLSSASSASRRASSDVELLLRQLAHVGILDQLLGRGDLRDDLLVFAEAARRAAAFPPAPSSACGTWPYRPGRPDRPSRPSAGRNAIPLPSACRACRIPAIAPGASEPDDALGAPSAAGHRRQKRDFVAVFSGAVSRAYSALTAHEMTVP